MLFWNSAWVKESMFSDPCQLMFYMFYLFQNWRCNYFCLLLLTSVFTVFRPTLIIPYTTNQMFTAVYRVIKGFFCNICRENPAIFTDCREILYHHRVFPADISEKHLDHPVNPCKHLQCTLSKDVQWVKIISELFCLLKFKTNPNLTKRSKSLHLC